MAWTRVWELVPGNAMLEAAAEPILRARQALRRELARLEKLVRNLANQDPASRRSVLIGIAFSAAFTRRVSIKTASKPALVSRRSRFHEPAA